ncbi:hypothetical protein D3C81_1680860 [compost metagenome]
MNLAKVSRMPSPCVVTVEAIAANTASGAIHITAPVIFSITCARSSITPAMRAPRSPSAASAVPKKIENTTICRISLLAMASATDFGTRCAMKSLSVKALVLRLVAAPTSGSGRPMLMPGWSTVAMIRPSVSDTSEAVMNHASAFTPTRPTVLASPMWAMPMTSVEKTSGAMIILISRRKTSVMTEM